MTSGARRRVFDLGGFRAEKVGMPARTADLYYAMMEMGWFPFLGVVSLSFLVLNIVFGLGYASMPGALANARSGSIVDGFFFSVETLGTVGYGTMAPATHGAHLLATAEILTGLFFSATMTGLIFARFARPRTSFVFSDVAVIAHVDGRRKLMIRLASTRLRPIADVHAQLSWLRKSRLADGRIDRHLVELPLVRSHNPQLAFSWTLVHEIDDASPMLEAMSHDDEFRLTVTVIGVDTLLANQALGAQTYLRASIVTDHVYEDMVETHGSGFVFDLGKIENVREQSTRDETPLSVSTAR